MLWQLKIGKWTSEGEVVTEQKLFNNKSRAMQETFSIVKGWKLQTTPLIQVSNGSDGHYMWQTWDWLDRGDVFIELRKLVKTERRKRLNKKSEHNTKCESKNTNYMNHRVEEWR